MKPLTRSAPKLLLCFILYACGSQSNDKARIPPIPNNAPGAIVRGTLVSGSGDTLEYRYDNELHTMDIDFKNVHAVLRQDTVASGIRYSNPDFVYTERHGISTLKQHGITVFKREATGQ
jgi:hypothetical protein